MTTAVAKKPAAKKAEKKQEKVAEQKEGKLFPEVDTDLAKACDALIAAKSDLEDSEDETNCPDCAAAVKDVFANAQLAMIEELKKFGKKSVRHSGRVFTLSLAAGKERISIKDEA